MSERIVNDPLQHGWVEVDGKWMWGSSMVVPVPTCLIITPTGV